jgi:Mrp family chromosome partitioning ATPase
MSLIETSLRKAKELAAQSGVHRKLSLDDSSSSVAPERTPQVDADAIASAASEARQLPESYVNAATMEQHGILLKVQDESAQRAYRIMRTRLQGIMRARGWRTVGVTAAGVGEGKTVTALNLAIAAAQDLATWVFLVDLDLQRPKIGSYLGLDYDKGLSDYLEGRAEFDEILYNPGVERLRVIPNREPIQHSSDALGSPRMAELCAAMAAEAPRHIVIFDLPPARLSDDVLKFAPNIDCVLFVVSEGATPRSQLQSSMEVLHDVNIAGVVLNRSSEREESGYY